MIKVGIIGATGYAGEELINILIKHPHINISYLAAKIDKSKSIAKIFPKLKNTIDLICAPLDIDLAISSCDLLFLALPHTVSMAIVPKFLKADKRVIDLSADYRLKNIKVYSKFYKVKHKDTENLKTAIYGLPEIMRAKIKNARLVSNPGCYPTAAILGLAPLIACSTSLPESIIIDAKSGVTGAGRQALLEYSFSELNEDVYAYKINMHQHMPEIEQELSRLTTRAVRITFVPHLLSINRGILETIYVRINQKSSLGLARDRKINPSTTLPSLRSGLSKDTEAKSKCRIDGERNRTIKSQKLIQLYKKFYNKEPFIRIKEEGEAVKLKDVINTNFCDITIRVFEEDNLIIIISAIDNLIKGAAGQAVQNMNIMYGFPEGTGLI